MILIRPLRSLKKKSTNDYDNRFQAIAKIVEIELQSMSVIVNCRNDPYDH